MRPALALCLSTWLPRRQPTIATSQLGTLLHQARSVSRGITCVLPCRLKPKREDGVSKLAFFDKGVRQTYSQAESKEAGIDLSKCVCPCLPSSRRHNSANVATDARYAASDLEYKAAAPNVYPLVILLQARGVLCLLSGCTPRCSHALCSDDVGSGDVAGEIDLPDPNTVQSQLTYASITRHADGTASVKVLKQKIQVLGAAYELQAIYGMGEDGTGDDACVVCLSAPKNTTVLPCRYANAHRRCRWRALCATHSPPVPHVAGTCVCVVIAPKSCGCRRTSAPFAVRVRFGQPASPACTGGSLTAGVVHVCCAQL